MALRAVFREVRRAAQRLDGRPIGARNSALSPDQMSKAVNLKAWLLPEPLSPEAVAYAASSSQDQWERLVHFGARHALQAQLGPDELLSHGLALLKELNTFEHEILSSEAFRQRVQAEVTRPPERAASSAGTVLHAGSHAALASVVDGSAPPEYVESQIEEALTLLSKRALVLASESAASRAAIHPSRLSGVLAGVNRALFDELGLRALPPTATPGNTSEEVLAYTHSALVHRALESGRGSPLAIGLILSEVIARCAPQLPTPRLLALPRTARPLGGVEPTSAHLGSLHAALIDVSRAAAESGDRAARPVDPSAPWYEQRILVACVSDAGAPSHRAANDAAGGVAGGGLQLLDPSAAGARTRLQCSDELIDQLWRSDARWTAWASAVEGDRASHRISGGSSPWEVPASALLDRRGVMALLLRQLLDLYHSAGTPHAIRMHNRCAELLASLESPEGKA